jgi:uncharacterized protein (DUF1810 family)
MESDDPYNLARFVNAQRRDYGEACAELRAGRKQSHWIWFIFPQMRGLGSSDMANYYGIGSRQEAAAYLAHPLLGARLRECTRLVLEVQDRSIDQILGYPDNLKFRSSMTLFDAVTPEKGVPGENPFRSALVKYFAGEPDPLTLGLL